MTLISTTRLAVIVLGLSILVVAQDLPERRVPVSPLGQTTPILDPENPPVSGVDEPGLDLFSAERSFISYGLSASETVDSNANNELDRQTVSSVTHLLGALDLQRLYSKTDIFAEYVGGGASYSNSNETVRQLHAAGFMGVTRWRTGRLTLRDSFSYLPEGSFSIGAFGGVPGLGIATGSGTSGLASGGLPGMHFSGNGQFGSVGLTPRIANSALVDAIQAINPRSAVTIAVGFANAHFFDDTRTYINSDRLMAQGGYSRMLSRRDQLGVAYGYQQFRFPQDAGGQINAHVANIRWGHVVSGRMSITLGAGPQYLILELPPPGPGTGSTRTTRWSANARAVLRYKFTRTNIALSYEKFTSAGSGLFAGSDTQAVRLGFTRPLARTYELYGDLGYAHNHRLQQGSLSGVEGNSFDHGFLRLLLRKHLGREYSAFVAYRFNDLALARCTEANLSFCGTGERHMGTIGIEWHPRPTRID